MENSFKEKNVKGFVALMKDENCILWISSYAPYDNVGHAGGKVHNYYLKYLKKENYNVRLLSICEEQEINKLDLDKYGIENNIIVLKKSYARKIERLWGRVNAEYNIFHKYAGKLVGYRERPLIKSIKEINKSGYSPKIIILEWTEVILLMPFIKKIYPKSKIIVIEEDVSYLSYYRFWKGDVGNIRKFIKKHRYEKLKNIEVRELSRSDMIILNNYKDKDLIVKEGFQSKRIYVWCPYFDNMRGVVRNPKYKKILFFGAMNRKENYLSAIWFIEKVIPLIKDLDLDFDIVGGNPSPVLQKYANHKIHILGFVKDIEPLFQEGLCLAAPLLFGAGIKIKVLEAMSSGLPVLTNDIGIEGIYAQNEKEYFLCETPEEYALIIRKLYCKNIQSGEISFNAKKYIDENYNLEKSAKEFEKIVAEFL